jgi:hypothetical protein
LQSHAFPPYRQGHQSLRPDCKNFPARDDIPELDCLIFARRSLPLVATPQCGGNISETLLSARARAGPVAARAYTIGPNDDDLCDIVPTTSYG